MGGVLELKEMSYEICPTCGARIVEIINKNKHTNGHYNEYIAFECGCEIHFSPNFMKEEIQRKCPKDPEEIKFQKKRINARNKLIEVIHKLDVDEQFKQNSFRSLGIFID